MVDYSNEGELLDEVSGEISKVSRSRVPEGDRMKIGFFVGTWTFNPLVVEKLLDGVFLRTVICVFRVKRALVFLQTGHFPQLCESKSDDL